MIDASVLNPLSACHVEAAAHCSGAAAQKRNEVKTAAHAALGDSGYNFFSVETHGRLGQPAIALLKTIGSAASEASLGAFSKRQFIDGVLQQLSAVLNKCNGRLLCPGCVSLWSLRDLFAESSPLCIAAPFRLVLPWVVEPPVLCFAHCASLCCFPALSLLLPAQTHRAGQAGRDAVSPLYHTSIPLPAELVKLPRLCCNTHSSPTCGSHTVS